MGRKRQTRTITKRRRASETREIEEDSTIRLQYRLEAGTFVQGIKVAYLI
jgi:hypothetical protein